MSVSGLHESASPCLDGRDHLRVGGGSRPLTTLPSASSRGRMESSLLQCPRPQHLCTHADWVTCEPSPPRSTIRRVARGVPHRLRPGYFEHASTFQESGPGRPGTSRRGVAAIPRRRFSPRCFSHFTRHRPIRRVPPRNADSSAGCTSRRGVPDGRHPPGRTGSGSRRRRGRRRRRP